MRFIFRADASHEIGSGHVMRSSVLAEEAISRGYECIFVGAISSLDWVSARIATLGFSQVIPNGRSFKAYQDSDVLILDTYSIPVADPFIARENWKLVLSISDAITPKYDADVELYPGLDLVSSGHNGRLILSGPDYVLIRNGIGKSVRKRSIGEALKLLIVGGGSDPFGFVDAIACVVSSMDLNVEIHTFTNRRNHDESKNKFIRHPIGSSLDVIASDVDVVFTTASTSSLEFIAREIPTGVVCAVGNQEDLYTQLGRLGCASQLGVYRSDGLWEFDLPAVKELLESQEKQSILKEATYSLIDLNGAKRVIDNLIKLGGGKKY